MTKNYVLKPIYNDENECINNTLSGACQARGRSRPREADHERQETSRAGRTGTGERQIHTRKARVTSFARGRAVTYACEWNMLV